MGHIAILLPREELVRQAGELAKGRDSIGEVRQIDTEHAVEEARASIQNGAGILICRGLQALRIRRSLNVPVVSVRLTAQGIGMLLRKAGELSGREHPRVALIAAEDMLCDTSCCGLLFGVDLHVFSYRTEEEYRARTEEALRAEPDVVIGGDLAGRMAREAGVRFLFLDLGADSFANAIESAETALQANEMNLRANAQIDALLNNTTNGYIQTDCAGCITKCNDILLEALECREQALLGRALPEVFPGLAEDVVANVLGGGNSYSTFLHIRSQAMVVILSAIRLEDGRIDGATLSCHKVYRSLQMDPRTEDGEIPGADRQQRTFDNVFHRSPAMARAVERAKLFSQSADPVLLAGDQGLESALMARCIHNNSTNRTGPFVQLNCAGLEPDEQMTAIFGTGYKNKDGEVDLGAFGMAENGTLLLQEIDKLTYAVQSNLYQAVRYRRVIRRGAERPICVNTRLVVTSGEDLWGLACAGDFRADLYYLLAGLRIDLPPLRERPEDLEDIIRAALRRVCETYHRYHVITSGGMQLLLQAGWPGNIVQLNGFMERLVLTATRRSIDEAAVRALWEEMFPPRQDAPAPGGEPQSREAQRILSALRENDGSRSLTAQQLGISTTTLWRKIKKLGLADAADISSVK